jgi:hypothetical protein
MRLHPGLSYLAPSGHSMADAKHLRNPGLAENKRFALKGLEMRTRFGSKVRSRFLTHPVAAPSGLIRVEN